MYVAALLLGALLPFDVIPPVATVAGVSVTTEKMVLALLVGAWLLLGARAVPTLHESKALLPTLVFMHEIWKRAHIFRN